MHGLERGKGCKALPIATVPLEQSERIFQQIEDEDAAQKVDNILAVVDQHFHPGDTALQVYGRLSRRIPCHNTNRESPPE